MSLGVSDRHIETVRRRREDLAGLAGGAAAQSLLSKTLQGLAAAREEVRRQNEELCTLERRARQRIVELARANEALRAEIVTRRRAEEALRDSQAQLAGILDAAADAILTLYEDHRIRLFNAAAATMFRCSAPDAIGQPVDRFIPEFCSTIREAVRNLHHAEGPDRQPGRQCVLTGRRADGEGFPIEATISRANVAGRILITAILRDITERQRAEEVLRNFAHAVEHNADSVFITNGDGVIRYVNPSFEKMTGYTREEAVGKTPRLLQSGKHDRRFYDQLWETIRSGAVFCAVVTNRKKDGEAFYQEETITPITDSHGNITNYVSTGRDITKRVQAEEHLRNSREQLRALAAHREAVREEERARIARELHDELGQALTGVKLELAWLALRQPADQPALRKKTRGMLRLIDSTIQNVRRILTELRPSLLDDLGLEATIEWQAREFQARTGIRCQVAARLADAVPDRQQSTALFRILQEALTNVARHAQATRVRITVHEELQSLHLRVQDNGRGITHDGFPHRQSLGLLGMQERAHLLGGEVTITGAPGEGTSVEARIPLKQHSRKPSYS